MKVKKITIVGMHKVAHKTYEFNDNITYFIGENGSGKSTVLEAIELGLLGYIPGYAKTNEGIMKHASGPVLAIELELDSGIKVCRTWTRTGSTISSKNSIEGCSPDEFASFLSDVELPIFNFNDFKSMTANKLKEWFISFLPDSGSDFNIKDELESDVNNRSLPYSDILNETLSWIDNRPERGLELIKALNAHLKEDQSYFKSRVAKLQGMIESLVRYDEAAELDEDAIRSELATKETQESLLTSYESKEAMRIRSEQAHEQLGAMIASLKAKLPSDDVSKDERISQIEAEIQKLTDKIKIMQADSADIQNALFELNKKRSLLPSANPTCPYTNEACDTAKKLSDKFKAQIAEIDKQIKFKQEEARECSGSEISKLYNIIRDLNVQLSEIRNDYNSLQSLQEQFDLQSTYMDIGQKPVDTPHSELLEQIKQLRELLVKIEANKQYDKLSDTVMKDKFKLENDLEIIKGWIKLTDANGLQSKLMDKPFEDLAQDMSTYLSNMFNEATEAKFNLVSKLNSFSFGLIRSSKYIEFDYLSSGERCLFTLALIMCILNRSDSKIKTIIIDDILDHLDESNSTYLFDALKKVEDVQFIMAGVKECHDSSICKNI